jgi:hypothetical protein
MKGRGLHLTQYKEKYQALVDTLMNIWVPQNVDKFFTN